MVQKVTVLGKKYKSLGEALKVCGCTRYDMVIWKTPNISHGEAIEQCLKARVAKVNKKIRVDSKANIAKSKAETVEQPTTASTEQDRVFTIIKELLAILGKHLTEIKH